VLGCRFAAWRSLKSPEEQQQDMTAQFTQHREALNHLCAMVPTCCLVLANIHKGQQQTQYGTER
jgi:hypothetical protein